MMGFGTSPLPHPATHTLLSMGGRVGARAGSASRREARKQ
jgi:hypothetical protein